MVENSQLTVEAVKSNCVSELQLPPFLSRRDNEEESRLKSKILFF